MALRRFGSQVCAVMFVGVFLLLGVLTAHYRLALLRLCDYDYATEFRRLAAHSATHADSS
jgi:hypothetical protein